MLRITSATLLIFSLLVTLCVADYRVTGTWVPNTDPEASGYQILLDGVVVVDAIPVANATADFTVPDITGQSVVLRTLGSTGGPTDFLDSNPIVLLKMTQPTTGFGISIVWED
jgi:hypothetical protein